MGLFSQPRRSKLAAVKDFTCDYPTCWKNYYDKSSLVKHYKDKHGGKSYKESQQNIAKESQKSVTKDNNMEQSVDDGTFHATHSSSSQPNDSFKSVSGEFLGGHEDLEVSENPGESLKKSWNKSRMYIIQFYRKTKILKRNCEVYGEKLFLLKR